MSMPNGMKLEQAYEAQRTLLTTRKTERRGGVMNESFTYNERSELTGAQRGSDRFAYAYDNIGNREIAQEAAEGITYAANELNQYTRISTDGENFTPEYDADGNQTLVQTSTGIPSSPQGGYAVTSWRVTYNAQNRAVKFESTDGSTIITCAYDYMGRRFEKQVTTNGTITTHQRFIYRNYLQIAAVNLKANASTPDLWFLIWDPTQPVATRPLAIRKDGTWYTYGWDLTKNICELYGQQGYIRTMYRYSPYGTVTAEGDVSQPIQWSSEMHDTELGLVYYNYRYYNPTDGRWTRRDPIGIKGGKAIYIFNYNLPAGYVDYLGKKREYTIQQIWNKYLEQNPNRNCAMDFKRADILASGCIGYTALMCGKSVNTLIASSNCFFDRQQAEKEMQKWKDEKKCCKEKTDNWEAAQPRLYSMHLFNNPLFTDTNGVVLQFLLEAIVYSNQESYDFGYVEDDGSIISANHDNRKENPATFFQQTPKEWADQVDPGNRSNYDIELWCVVCNDNQIYKHNCEGRHTSNFFK